MLCIIYAAKVRCLIIVLSKVLHTHIYTNIYIYIYIYTYIHTQTLSLSHSHIDHHTGIVFAELKKESLFCALDDIIIDMCI